MQMYGLVIYVGRRQLQSKLINAYNKNPSIYFNNEEQETFINKSLMLITSIDVFQLILYYKLKNE